MAHGATQRLAKRRHQLEIERRQLDDEIAALDEEAGRRGISPSAPARLAIARLHDELEALRPQTGGPR